MKKPITLERRRFLREIAMLQRLFAEASVETMLVVARLALEAVKDHYCCGENLSDALDCAAFVIRAGFDDPQRCVNCGHCRDCPNHIKPYEVIADDSAAG